MTERKRRRLKLFAVQAAETETSSAIEARGVGEMLRSQRERLGWSIPDVAANLKIRRVMIEAIERGRFRDLPGLAYAVGFVRAYAELLGLDSAEIVRRFRAEATGIEERRELNFPRPLGESRLPGGAAISVAVLAAVVAYGVWYATSFTHEGPPARVTAVPDRLAALAVPAPEPVAPLPPPPAPPVAVETPAPALAPQLVPPSAAPAAVATPAPAAPPRETSVAALPPPVAPADPAAPKVYGDVSSPDVRIVIRATQAEAWVQVKDAAGALVFSRVLKPGEAYRVSPSRSGLLLTAGNAGSVEIAVDGKIVPAIAKGNMIRRDVALDPARLQAGTAVPDRPAAAPLPPPPPSGG